MGNLKSHITEALNHSETAPVPINTTSDLSEKLSLVNPEDPTEALAILKAVLDTFGHDLDAGEVQDALYVASKLAKETKEKLAERIHTLEQREAALDCRERFFWGVFGDKDKRALFVQARDAKDGAENNAKNSTDSSDSLQRRVDEVVRSALRASEDGATKAIFESMSVAHDLISKINDVLLKIRKTKSEISDAELMEAADLLTDSTLISVLSHASTSDVSGAAKNVQRSLDRLKEALEDCQSKQGNLTKGDVWVFGETIDFALDLFDVADFISFFHLMNFSDLESDLNELKSKLDGLSRSILTDFEIAESKINRIISAIRFKLKLY